MTLFNHILLLIFVTLTIGNMKMVPLVFVMMTRRQASDYVAVFREIKRMTVRPAVIEIFSDFERAAWKAVREVFDTSVNHVGCNFHWAQSIMKKVSNNTNKIKHYILLTARYVNR